MSKQFDPGSLRTQLQNPEPQKPTSRTDKKKPSPKVADTYRLPPETKQQIDQLAKFRMTSKNQLVTHILDQYLQDHQNELQQAQQHLRKYGEE